MPRHRLAPEPGRRLDSGYNIPSIGERRRIATGSRPDIKNRRSGFRQKVQNVDMHPVERGGLIQVSHALGRAIVDRHRSLGLRHARPGARSSGHAPTRSQLRLKKPISEPMAAIASAILKAVTTV